MQLVLALIHAALGASVSLLSLHAARGLSRQLRALQEAAQRLKRELPHFTAMYFYTASRVLAWTAAAYLIGAASDALQARLMPSTFAAHFLGYGSAIFLLCASILLILQAGQDRKLGLHRRGWRIAYMIGGAAGVVTSIGGKLMVAEFGGIWP
jgi:hypothetical protein